MMNKLVSVIMAVYKEEKYMLTESIKSILKQTYSNFEFIIIIDNPNDSWRREFINSFNDNRIKLIVNDSNLGLSQSLNKALKYATGEYIARMDADDISREDRLEKQKDFIEKNDCDLCGSNFFTFSDKQDFQSIKMPEFNESIKKILNYTNCMGHPTWFGKRTVFIKNNGYRNVFSCEDYDFLLRSIANNFILGNIQEELLYYRLNLNSISRKNAGKQVLIANYLAKNFRKGKIIAEENIEEFLQSEKFKSEVKKYDEYYKLKIERKINKKRLKKLIFTLRMCCKSKYFFKDILRNIYKKYILWIEKKEKYGRTY